MPFSAAYSVRPRLGSEVPLNLLRFKPMVAGDYDDRMTSLKFPLHAASASVAGR